MIYKILPGLTNSEISGWKNKVKEIDELNIEEISLFPTNLKKEQREDLYGFLEKTNLNKIPHVHLRHDMEQWELDFLIKRYKTEVFNIHPVLDATVNSSILKKYSEVIFIENLHFLPTVGELETSGGLCLDVSHWEDAVLNGDREYDKNIRDFLASYRIGCSHISAMRVEPHIDINPKYPNRMEYADHRYNDMEEFDYIKKYIKFLPRIISIELEDSFFRQLKVLEYLKSIIN